MSSISKPSIVIIQCPIDRASQVEPWASLAATAAMPRQQQQPQAADHGLGHGGQGQRGEACHLQQQRRRLYRSLLLLPLLLLVLLLLGLATCPLAAAFIVPSPRTSSSSIQSSRQHQQRPSLVPRSLGLDFFGGNKNKKRPQKLPEQSPFRPELQIEYKDGLGAKIWIYLFSGKIAKVCRWVWHARSALLPAALVCIRWVDSPPPPIT